MRGSVIFPLDPAQVFSQKKVLTEENSTQKKVSTRVRAADLGFIRRQICQHRP